MKKFDLSPVYTSVEDFKHWFLPREGIVDSFVVEQNGVITDFGSFYHLPSTIMNHPAHKTLRAAYSFYNVATKKADRVGIKSLEDGRKVRIYKSSGEMIDA